MIRASCLNTGSLQLHVLVGISVRWSHDSEPRRKPAALKYCIQSESDSSTSNTPLAVLKTWRAGSISLRLTAVCKDNGAHAREFPSDGMFVPRQSVGRSPMEFGCTGSSPTSLRPMRSSPCAARRTRALRSSLPFASLEHNCIQSTYRSVPAGAGHLGFFPR
jgi:hypothetical protein